MGPDDLLCSRNARPQKALVGRAQWKIIQPPSLRENEQAWKDHSDGEGRSMRAVKGGRDHSPMRSTKNWKGLARASGTSRRASGWMGENVARSQGANLLAL